MADEVALDDVVVRARGGEAAVVVRAGLGVVERPTLRAQRTQPVATMR
jgi:hypothetical protein